MKDIRIFGLSQSTQLANEIACALELPEGASHLETFRDKEMAPKFDERIRDKQVFLVGSTHNSDAVVEMILTLDAVRRSGCKDITVICPYLGYARQDRRGKKGGDGIGVSAVLRSYMVNGMRRLILADLHATQSEAVLEDELINVAGRDIFLGDPEIKALFANPADYIIASPDAGGFVRASMFAEVLGLPVVVFDKHRKVANEVASMRILGDVKGKRVVFVDDMLDTGTTLALAAQVAMDNGALEVYAFATHPLFSGDAFKTIGESVIKRLFVANTLPIPAERNGFKRPENITVVNSKTIFANVIKALSEGRSTRAFPGD